MYTQCPKCSAIFSVSEIQLHAHNGLVRCGHCSDVFHASSNEVDQFPAEQEPAKLNEEVEQYDAPAAITAGDDVEEGEEIGESRIEPNLFSKEQEQEVPVPTEDTEEITIDAPSTLWGKSDEFEEPKKPGLEPQPTSESESQTGSPENAEALNQRAPESKPSENETPAELDTPGLNSAGPILQSPYEAADVKMVELPQPRPFKTAALSLSCVFLVLLLIWQVKSFYLNELAQFAVLRPYLSWVCQPLACEVPPRISFSQIELSGTSVSINPEVPGGLRIKVNLLNRAHFAQPYPPLQVTLTDRAGSVVGQRTYHPIEYIGENRSPLLPTREVQQINIDLAQPSEQAVGYEVQLVAPTVSNL